MDKRTPPSVLVRLRLAALLLPLALILALPACVARTPAGYDAGLELARSGDHAGAVASFDQALAKDPAFAPARVARAKSLTALGQPRPALDELRQASDLAPEDPEVWIAMAELEEKLFLLDSAAAHYGRAGDLTAQAEAKGEGQAATLARAADLYMAQALNLSRSGNHAQAAKAYGRAGLLDPQNPWAEAGQAAGLALAGRCDQARIHFDRFLDMMPGDADGLLGRGLCAMETGHMEDGLADFQALLALDPDNGEALFHQARCLAALDRVDEAVAGFARVVELDPERAEVVRNQVLSPKTVLKLLKQARTPDKADLDRLLPVMECFAGQMLGKDMPGCRQMLNDL